MNDRMYVIAKTGAGRPKLWSGPWSDHGLASSIIADLKTLYPTRDFWIARYKLRDVEIDNFGVKETRRRWCLVADDDDNAFIPSAV